MLYMIQNQCSRITHQWCFNSNQSVHIDEKCNKILSLYLFVFTPDSFGKGSSLLEMEHVWPVY